MSSAGYGFMAQTRRIGILTADGDFTAWTIVGPVLSSGFRCCRRNHHALIFAGVTPQISGFYIPSSRLA
jgi:hypothetical protein